MNNWGENFFKIKFSYNHKVVNKVITIIKFSKDEDRVRNYSLLLFKMMHNVVRKNIGNYRNLSYNSPIEYIPDFNELVSDCFIIMMNCVKGYKISKRNNFYFYYNKALSRRFFRDFQKELKHNDSNVMTNDDMVKNNLDYCVTNDFNEIDIILENYDLNEIEKALCRHRIDGGRVNDFIKSNNITLSAYNKILRSIKIKIKDIKID